MNTFKGQGIEKNKFLCPESNCELVIVPHNLKNKLQPLDIRALLYKQQFFSAHLQF